MTGAAFALLWLAWILGGGSPGPATLSIAGTSMARGRQAGLAMSLGIVLGSATLGLAAALGMSAVMMTNAWMFTTLRYVGAAYLLYLAIKSMRSALTPHAPQLQKAYSGTPLELVGKGMLLHLTNPKALLGWGAIYTIAATPNAGTGELFRIFGFLMAGSCMVFFGYALLFSTPRVVAGYQKMRRWFEGAFAILFGAASLKILTTKAF